MHIRPIVGGIGLSAALALGLACDQDQGGDEPLEFRSDGGASDDLATKKTVTSFKIRGCDPPFPWWRPGMDPSEAPEEWHAMIDVQARMMAEEVLVAAFLADPANHEMCAAACDEAGSAWEGGAVLASDADHEFGSVAIVGECPNDTLATELPATSVADVGCACAE